MEEDPAEDPFSFLLNHSTPSLSQEQELRNYPFIREFDQFLDSSPPTTIIMVSPPQSPQHPSSCEVAEESVDKGKSSVIALVNKASELLKTEVHSDSGVDLLGVLKQKGVHFPHPKWWPGQ